MHVEHVGFRDNGENKYACGVCLVQRPRRGEVCMWNMSVYACGLYCIQRRGMYVENIGLRDHGKERYACGVC